MRTSTPYAYGFVASPAGYHTRVLESFADSELGLKSGPLAQPKALQLRQPASALTSGFLGEGKEACFSFY
jgi:hypothetical protein